MELRTDRALIRDIREEDYPLYYELYSNRETALLSGIKPLLSLESTISFLRRLTKRDGMMLLSAFELFSGDFIGTLSLTPTPYNSGLEIGYTISPAKRRKGYATEIVKTVIEALPYFDREGLVDHFDLVIRSNNTPSLKTASRLGFYLVGQKRHGYRPIELIYRLYIK